MNDKQQYLAQLLKSENISTAINENIGNLIEIIPEIQSMIGFEHKHPHHHLDVWNHTMLAMSVSPNNFDIRLALLLHDIGKPHSYQEDGGFRRFHGHPDKSADMAKEILERLDFDKEYSDKICTAIKLHDTAIRINFLLQEPELANLIFEIQKCDVLAHNPRFNNKRLKYIDNINQMFVKLAIPQEYLAEYTTSNNPEK